MFDGWEDIHKDFFDDSEDIFVKTYLSIKMKNDSEEVCYDGND